MSETYNIYFAGELFDHKDLIGNKLLALFIEKISKGKYKCILPQDQDYSDTSEQGIRDNLLYLLTTADLALFNFDGSDLDSGTVVEYVVAKFLDMPSVILRSDFRKGGDQTKGDAWNLMCSFYPRTEILDINSALHYQKAIQGKTNDYDAIINEYYTFKSTQIIEAFEKVCKTPSLLGQSPQKAEAIYDWARQFAGKSYEDQWPTPAALEKLIQHKRDHRLL